MQKKLGGGQLARKGPIGATNHQWGEVSLYTRLTSKGLPPYSYIEFVRQTLYLWVSQPNIGLNSRFFSYIDHILNIML
jgi:hypothetical protein